MPHATWIESDNPHPTDLALAGLERMYDPTRQLFARVLRYRPGGLSLQGASLRYTAISLLGLVKAHQAGRPEPLPIREVLQGLIQHLDQCHNIGDLGLILWNFALFPEDYPGILWQRIRQCYAQLKSGKHVVQAVELEWLLTGLIYAYRQWDHEPIARMAHQVYQHLLGYYYHPLTGLFSCGSGAGGSRFRAISRQRLGFLAEQAYGIYAFAMYAQTFEDPFAAEYALLCARRLTHLQGAEGQWWWRYNVNTGQVASRYPLFPVHQEAVMPMALTKLTEVTGEDFQEAVERGRTWVRQHTHPPAIDWRRQVIWHTLQPKAPWHLFYYFNSAVSILVGRCIHLARHFVPAGEVRSQDLGWILYAET